MRKKLIQRIKLTPKFWWFRPFYDSTLFIDGYRVSFFYVGIMPNLDQCAEAIKEAIAAELEKITDEQFQNHPSIEFEVGPLRINFYVGGPGSVPPPPPPGGGG